MEDKAFFEGLFPNTQKEHRKTIPWDKIVSFEYEKLENDIIRIIYSDSKDKNIGSEELEIDDLIRSHISYVEIGEKVN